MNITSKGRYALRIMIDLAQNSEGYVSLKAVADRQSISMKYLEMIAGNLKKYVLIESTRGKDGGYKLTKQPADYTVLEILKCVEDNLAPVACIKGGQVECENAGGCLTLGMWKELDEVTNNYLSTVTLDDLLTGNKWK